MSKREPKLLLSDLSLCLENKVMHCTICDMNTNWLTLPQERRFDLLNQVTEFTGLPALLLKKIG